MRIMFCLLYQQQTENSLFIYGTKNRQNPILQLDRFDNEHNKFLFQIFLIGMDMN